MKKLIYILLSALALVSASAETMRIEMKTEGQAYFDTIENKYVSDEYMSSSPDSTKFIFFEFDIKSLKGFAITDAYLSFKWAADVEFASPAFIKINKGAFTSPLTGNAVNDANAGILTNSSTLVDVHKTIQDENYSLDVSAYLKSIYKNEDYLTFSISSYIAAAFLYGAGEENPLNPPTLTVNYTSDVIPEPSTYAVILGVICAGFIVYRRKK